MMLSLLRPANVGRHLQIGFAPLRSAASAAPTRDDRLPVKASENVAQTYEPPLTQPIQQELIKKVPVEFHGVNPNLFGDHSEWYPIFRLPYLNAVRRVIKLKMYLTGFSLASSAIYASQLVMGASISPWKPAILSVLTLAGLVYVGDYARRLIVQIYVSKDLEYVRFSRLSFFAKRRDMVLPGECIIRLTEINSSSRTPILNVKFRMPEKGVELDYDHYEFYELGFRIPIGLGGVLDKQAFNTALGKILVKKPLNN